MRRKEALRIVYECGFSWARDSATADPVVPPEADVVVWQLTTAQAASALHLPPEEWWREWGRGWVAGLTAREAASDA